jgi:hypothetical protein
LCRWSPSRNHCLEKKVWRNPSLLWLCDMCAESHPTWEREKVLDQTPSSWGQVVQCALFLGDKLPFTTEYHCKGRSSREVV